MPSPSSTAKSQAAFETARRVMPGGVSSPVRAFKAVGGTPRFIARAKGSRLWDIDGNEYIDLVGSWGPMIAGHAHDEVTAALQARIADGTSFGAPCELEADLAEAVCEAMPGVEMVRFVSSGTEATMSAIRLARGVAAARGDEKRTKLVKFEGCYHGHADALLVAAGSGAATFGTPNSPGVPAAAVADTLLQPFNDLDALKKLFADAGDEIAAVIIEPMPGNMGMIRPLPGFLEGLRELCTASGAMLIFDEVMSGFRVARGGACEVTGVAPDIVCLGKVIGGGMPVGAYGASREVMENVSPAGPVYQAGTLSGNPIAMTAGIETLRLIAAEGFHAELHAKSKRLADGLVAAAAKHSVPLQGDAQGGMFGIYFSATPVRNFEEAGACDHAAFAKFFHAMLDRGVSLPPSSYEAMFLSSAHTDADIDAILQAADESFAIVAAG